MAVNFSKTTAFIVNASWYDFKCQHVAATQMVTQGNGIDADTQGVDVVKHQGCDRWEVLQDLA